MWNTPSHSLTGQSEYVRRMNVADVPQKRISVTELLLDYHLGSIQRLPVLACLAWNVGGTPVEHYWAGAGAGAGAWKLWCDARRRRRLNFGLFAMECLVGRASLECWSRKPNGGILRAWVRSEPPVLIMWLSPLFQLSSNFEMHLWPWSSVFPGCI